jgi:hypothetical protein
MTSVFLLFLKKKKKKQKKSRGSSSPKDERKATRGCGHVRFLQGSVG